MEVQQAFVILLSAAAHPDPRQRPAAWAVEDGFRRLAQKLQAQALKDLRERQGSGVGQTEVRYAGTTSERCLLRHLRETLKALFVPLASMAIDQRL